MDILPSYQEISLCFNKNQCVLDPSEAHGLISGVLCGNEKNNAWQKLINAQQSAEINDLLRVVYDVSEKKLKEFLFDYELILPEDSQTLPLRAEALTLWCQGFITGLKYVNANIAQHNSNEMTEALNDIIEIAKMHYEDVSENEEDESAYVELVEYVRMAVIFLYQELHDSQQAVNQEQIH
jgi:uncharacterized protein